ncbi:hypothetical protein [Nocardioides sp.]|jgi:hypothetical protein|uniref:hypothetical protein n=1 Tax=Nocardioides sp. TaxID=35761 RepID=UPI002602693E|nr:hypothetical protein [Nocardioides sp.]
MVERTRSAASRLVAPVVLLGAAALVVGGVVVGMGDLKVPFAAGEQCSAEVDGHRVELSIEQAENASTIAAIGVRRGLPARAVSIALATAYQESDLQNLDYGDRDSLGLFQQRPSQGWGSTTEVQDPIYSTNAFYDALVDVADYRSLPITEAAQAVQRSGFPDAYADHEQDARALASALTGNSPEAFACRLDGDAPPADPALAPSGLTARADGVRTAIAERFGDLPLGGFAPAGVSTGHMEGSTHYDGRAIDVFFRPINDANQQRGWALAQYVVAHADRLGVQTVIFDDRIWRAGRDEAWRDYRAPSGANQAILEHRDHVHVDVFS